MASSTAVIKIAQKQLGLDDDTYRAKLINITGKSSTRDMTEIERQKVVEVFRAEGFRPVVARRANGRVKLSGRFAGKLQALWIAGYNLGIVDNRDDAALEAFVKRQTGLDSARWLHRPGDAAKVIEAVKGWISREAGVVWEARKPCPEYAQTHGYKIAQAQWRIIIGPHADRITRFWQVVTSNLDRDVAFRDLTDAQWIAIMDRFGREIRLQKKAVKP